MKILLLVFVYLVLCTSHSFAELKQYQNSELGFSLNYSTEFEPLNSELPAVALLLRFKSSAYPTFNILSEDCSLRQIQKLSASQQAERLRSDYARIGLTESEIKEALLTQISEILAFKALISYTNKGQRYTSIVTRIIGPKSCLILTYIDLAQHFEGRKFHWQQLVNGLQIKFDDGGSNSQKPNFQPSYQNYSALFFGLTIFFVALYFLRRRLKMPN